MLWPGSSHARDRAGTVFHAHTFSTGSSEKKPDGWACWSHRDESRPDFFVAENPSLGGDGSLGISGASNISAHGCWYTVVEGIKPGEHYRLEAFYRIEGVSCPRRQVWSRLNWRDDEGKRVDYPEYVPDAGTQGLWRKVAGIYQAPEGAAKVRIELFLSFCPQGTVWWDGITLDRVPAPSKRLVRVGTANCRPGGNSSVEENIEEFCRVLDEAGGKGCDIVCLSEAITKVGITPTLSFLDIAEPVPGPTTERLGEMAAKYKMYIVAGIVEKEHGAIYNIAVLIDRSGKVAGKYRKTTLPFGESEGGVAPGNSFPV
ncbi:MAG: carbon-nitrogen hydrolase family protein, partial [Gemmatimonadota bacterium]|nr:carbon-nitrogen hydrolase family protein [Gemmatimonadota bacterium]